METDPNKGTIENLLETLDDGIEGFKKTSELLADEDAEMAAEMVGFANERRQMSAELRDVASSLGADVDQSGSAGGALHRTWLSLKDMMTGDDPHAVLGAAEEGEDHAVEQYQDALSKDDLNPALRSVIERQASSVRAAHDRVRELRDRTDG